MKIKNQYIISISTFGVILAIIAASIIFTQTQTTQLASQEATVQRILTGVSNLNYISNDYFLYHEESSISQWQAQFDAVSADLSKLNSTDPGQQTLINNIYTDMEHLDSVFVGVVSFLEAASPEVNVRVLPGFQTQWSRIAVQVQALAFDVQQLSGVLNAQIYQTNFTNIILILALLAVFGVYFVTNYIMTYRRTLRHVYDLKEGLKTIGSGNLDYSLQRYRKEDEIGEISRSVNQMAANLKTVTASKVDLEREIEERKRAEAELERSTQQLKEAEHLATVGATAGMVGHDIRNPLQAITSDVYLAKSDLSTVDGEGKEGLKESLDEIGKNVMYINKIVTDLQDYARPLKPVAETTDFEGLCETVLLKTDIPKAIKACHTVDEGAKQFMSDPELLRRILSNLVINAVQAMPQGGELTIHAYRKQGDIIIDVQDTGIGIPEDVKPKLFTPLFTTKSKGQGFGLVVAKRVTESMKGTISFVSKEGQGTTFTVRLPAKG